MISLLFATLAHTRPTEARGVHFHVDETGRPFACHCAHRRPERPQFHRHAL